MIWCRSGEGCRSYACSAHAEHLVDVRVSQTQPSRITTVGALRIDIWIASRQLASHRVLSVTFRVHECPDLMKTTLRKSLEKIARKTRNSGGKCRNEGLTSEARKVLEMAHSRATTPRKRTRPLPDVAHAADRAAYPSRTTVKFWCGPVEAIRRNSSLAETSLTYPLRKRIEALDGDTRGVGDTRNPSRE